MSVSALSALPDAPAPAPVASYRYLFVDLLSGTVLEELPVACDRFSRIINGAGSLSCSLALGDLGALDWRSATLPRRTALYVERDDTTLVWGGIIWKRRPGQDMATVQIEAQTLESYYTRRRVGSLDGTDLVYTAADVLDVVRGILADANSQASGDIRLDATANLSGTVTTVTYKGYERKRVLDEWQKLATLDPGFEFTVEVDRGPTGLFTHTLMLAAPRLAEGIEPIVCEFPGNVADYDYPEDGSNAVNSLVAVGAGEGASMLTDLQIDLDDLNGGVPLLEDELSAKDETDLIRLQARNAAELSARIGDATVPVVTLRGDAEPAFGSYPLGVAARLRLTGRYHPATSTGAPGLDTTRRVTGWSVEPAQAERAERVTLALGRAP